MHGHIAVTGRAGEMRVMWGSAKSDKPRVKVLSVYFFILFIFVFVPSSRGIGTFFIRLS